jgi:hypothetical protein
MNSTPNVYSIPMDAWLFVSRGRHEVKGVKQALDQADMVDKSRRGPMGSRARLAYRTQVQETGVTEVKWASGGGPGLPSTEADVSGERG